MRQYDPQVGAAYGRRLGQLLAGSIPAVDRDASALEAEGRGEVGRSEAQKDADADLVLFAR